MDWLKTAFAFLTGIGLRLVLPVLVTVIAITFLRKLDSHWQEQATRQAPQPAVEKPHCWEIKGCREQDYKVCAGAQSEQPCWQVFRQKNGYLREGCLECQVFQEMPLPVRA